MPSVVEIIRKLQTEAATGAKFVHRNAEPIRLATDQQALAKQLEKQRRLDNLKEVTNRVISAYGLLDALQDIKRNFIDGKYPKHALLVDYVDVMDDSYSAALLELIWGKSFRIKKDRDDNNILDYGKHLFGSPLKDYNLIRVYAHLDESLSVHGGESVYFSKREYFDKQIVLNAIAQTFLNPERIQMYEDPTKNNMSGPWSGMPGGPEAGPGGGQGSWGTH